ncbi:MAG TPA: DUF2950 domain-containing protein [Steroidobacteraceae bacterium]|nr:DUF2950 domain-containing protein [Steroidobacteraceae bacterium]
MRPACVCAFALAASLSLPLAARAKGAEAAPESFDTPERAATALADAVRANDPARLERILGPAGRVLVESGDAVADREARARFAAEYARAHRIEPVSAKRAVLIVGAQSWPLPIPLVSSGSGWHFDAQSGAQEILNRRVGRNELAVMEVCREYVRAQREYAALGAAVHGPKVYAQHFLSRAGAHDGLYWPVQPGERPSPLGPLVAQARAAGYPVGESASSGHRQPYKGYLFRILTRQGAHAPGGARNYLGTDGRMTAGFALLAYPARYGDSGVMTFIIDQHGILFEKDLGAKTAERAAAIESFDPDASWHAP